MESDRIQFDRISREILDVANMNPVLDAGSLTEYRSFEYLNTPSTKNTIFDPNDLNKTTTGILEINKVVHNNVLNPNGTTKCPTVFCNPQYSNGVSWPNRVPLAGIYSNPSPQQYFYWDNFIICFGSIQGQRISSLPNNRNMLKDGVQMCDYEKVVRAKC